MFSHFRHANSATLGELARRYEAALTDDMDVADMCYTANAGRSHFNARLAVTGATMGEMRQGLAAFIEGQPSEAVSTGRHDGAARPRVAFLFTGQGAQYPRMGLELYATSPTFRSALDECAAGLSPFMERGLLDVLRDSSDTTPINETLVRPTRHVRYRVRVGDDLALMGCRAGGCARSQSWRIHGGLRRGRIPSR